MLGKKQVPEFAVAAWYSDPKDHRCPHDAWLESLELTKPAAGTRQEPRKTSITITLLGAYHDGHILFRYSGVSNYELASESCGRGIGDWLRDELSMVSSGLLRHHITWCVGPTQESHWLIEAEDISYEWLPQSS